MRLLAEIDATGDVRAEEEAAAVALFLQDGTLERDRFGLTGSRRRADELPRRRRNREDEFVRAGVGDLAVGGETNGVGEARGEVAFSEGDKALIEVQYFIRAGRAIDGADEAGRDDKAIGVNDWREQRGLAPTDAATEVGVGRISESDPAEEGTASAVERDIERPGTIFGEGGFLRGRRTVGHETGIFHAATRIDDDGAGAIAGRLGGGVGTARDQQRVFVREAAGNVRPRIEYSAVGIDTRSPRTVGDMACDGVCPMEVKGEFDGEVIRARALDGNGRKTIEIEFSGLVYFTNAWTANVQGDGLGWSA